MDPPLAAHVTAVFELPLTEAAKVCVPPVEMLVALGETVTATAAGPGVMVVPPFPPVPPQEATHAHANATTHQQRNDWNADLTGVNTRRFYDQSCWGLCLPECRAGARGGHGRLPITV